MIHEADLEVRAPTRRCATEWRAPSNYSVCRNATMSRFSASLSVSLLSFFFL